MRYSSIANKAEQREEKEYKIIRTKPKDWKRIRKGVLRVDSITFRDSENAQDEEDIGNTFKDRESFNYYVKSAASNVIGYMICSQLEAYDDIVTDCNVGRDNTIYVESIAVLPRYQGRGIGDGLIKMLNEDVKREGYSRITLHTINSDMKRLAERNGFITLGREKDWDKGKPAWYMRKLTGRFPPIIGEYKYLENAGLPAGEGIKIVKSEPEEWKKNRKDIIGVEEAASNAETRQYKKDMEKTFRNRRLLNYFAKDSEENIFGYLMSSKLEYCEETLDEENIEENNTIFLKSLSVLPCRNRSQTKKDLLQRLIEDAGKEGYFRVTLASAIPETIKMAAGLGFEKLFKIEDWVYDKAAWYMERKIKKPRQMSEVKVFRSNPDEWKDIRGGMREFGEIVFNSNPGGNMRDVKGAFNKPKALNYYAKTANGRIAGHLISKKRKNGKIYVDSIGVLPRFRKKGIGEEMMRKLMDDARKEGYSKIALHTVSMRMKALSEKLGLESKRIVKKYLYGRDGWYMEGQF